jgi:hypothetical protein
MGRRNKIITGNEEARNTNTGKEEKLAGTSTGEAIRKATEPLYL